jgi:hypothetical protein
MSHFIASRIFCVRDCDSVALKNLTRQPYLTTLPSPSFFLAKAACLSVSAPALTIRSIFLDFDIPFKDSFAFLIFWLEDGRASL